MQVTRRPSWYHSNSCFLVRKVQLLLANIWKADTDFNIDLIIKSKKLIQKRFTVCHSGEPVLDGYIRFHSANYNLKPQPFCPSLFERHVTIATASGCQQFSNMQVMNVFLKGSNEGEVMPSLTFSSFCLSASDEIWLSVRPSGVRGQAGCVCGYQEKPDCAVSLSPFISLPKY